MQHTNIFSRLRRKFFNNKKLKAHLKHFRKTLNKDKKYFNVVIVLCSANEFVKELLHLKIHGYFISVSLL